MTSETTTVYHHISSVPKIEVSLAHGGQTHLYQLVDAALSLASPVLGKMVDPKSPWVKTTEQGLVKVTLHDDDPEALDMLFKLMHFQRKNIPEKVDLTRLFNLALVCDKYDCVDVGMILIQECERELKKAEKVEFWQDYYNLGRKKYFYKREDDNNSGLFKRSDDRASTANMLLFISYVFGLDMIFPRAYKATLMLWRPKNVSGEADDVMNGPTCLPDRLYKQFMSHWEEKRSLVIKSVQDLFNFHSFGLVYGKRAKCSQERDCTLCDISLYGSFVRRLCYAGLFPVEVKSDAMSILELSNRVLEIQIGSYWTNGRSQCFPHGKCRDDFEESLQHGAQMALEFEAISLKDFKNEKNLKRSIWGDCSDGEGSNDEGDISQKNYNDEEDENDDGVNGW